MLLLEKTRSLYSRFERPVSSLSFVFGFIVDSLTLRRIDAFRDNLWIVCLLAVAGLFIALTHIQEGEIGDESNPSKKHFWYVNLIQFAFGGLLSAYLVFYFRSTDFFSTWPFILIIALAVIANEVFKNHYVRFSFQISLFFLSVYAFAIFLIPVLLHKIGSWIFLLSGAISLTFIAIFSLILSRFIKKELIESKKMILSSIFGIFVLINFLYFTNLIPPIPLSLKDAGAYHSIQKNSDGNYNVTYEDYGWRGYFKLYPEFKEIAGSPVYVYSAIFSPKKLNLTVVHEWEHYNTEQNKWVMERAIALPVVGGRDGGFRTYSMRSSLTPGKWRVVIKTKQGQTIGHVRFNIVPVDTEPKLVSGLKQ
jgi:hypothetical protein